jgi:hypothetical protein
VNPADGGLAVIRPGEGSGPPVTSRPTRGGPLADNAGSTSASGTGARWRGPAGGTAAARDIPPTAGDAVAYPSGVEESPSAVPENDALVVALGELMDANLVLQDVLRESAARTERYIERLRAGDRVLDLVGSRPVNQDRAQDNEAIDQFTRARQRSRAATFRRLGEEGMSRKEIAELWGFSQQMVSRILNYRDVQPRR